MIWPLWYDTCFCWGSKPCGCDKSALISWLIDYSVIIECLSCGATWNDEPLSPELFERHCQAEMALYQNRMIEIPECEMN